MSAFDPEIPFVDREADLQMLRDICTHDYGVCLLVIGRRGIGKSRLLRQFVQEAASDERLVCVLHEGYRTSTGLQEFSRLEIAIAEHPVVKALVAGQGPEAWSPSLNQWVRNAAAMLDTTPGRALGHLPLESIIQELVWNKVPLDEGDIVDNFLRTLRTLSQVLREDQRLVLVLDPGVNLDEGSLDLRKLRMLYDIVRNLPTRMVVVVALRDSDPAAHDPELPLLPNVEVHRSLEPFSPYDVHTLLRIVFGEDTPFETAHEIHRRYGGDPFSTELAVLCARRDPSPRQALLSRCPDKLSGLMQAFHDGFPNPLYRKILRILGIPDEPVPLDFLFRMLDGKVDRETLERILHSPEMGHGIVTLILPEEGRQRYRPYHETFAEFLRERARQYQEFNELNQRAGQYYREEGRPSLALYHFGQAGDPEGIRQTLERGLEWHRLQGETRRLLQLYEILRPQELTVGERFLLGKSLAWAHSLAGESEDVVSMVEDLLPGTGEKSRERAELLLLRGDAYHNSSRYHESHRDFEVARELMEEIGETDTLLYRQVILEKAHMLTHLGDFQASEKLHSQLLSEQGQFLGPNARVEALMQAAREVRRYGEVLVFTGEWEEAEKLLQLARRQFIHLGHRRGEGDALRRIADLHLLHGGPEEYTKALKAAARAQALLTEVGSRGASYMGLVLGEGLRGLGRLEEARHTFQEAFEEFSRDESIHLLCIAELGLAECTRMASGEPPLSLYERALRRYEHIGFEWGVGTALIYRSLASLTVGEKVAASEDLQRARQIFWKLGLRPPMRTIQRVEEDEDLGFHPLIVL